MQLTWQLATLPNHCQNCYGAWMLLARKNGLTVRLSENPAEVRAAQRLRYQIFYEELSARPNDQAAKDRLDADRFDAFCDHLMVIDEGDISGDPVTTVSDGKVVGTYRLLRQEVAKANGGFYSASAFDLEPLLKRKPELRFLEVGRSCVAQPFRSKPVAELLWQGIWNYVRHYRLDVMLGCASLEGTDPEELADELSFLKQVAAAPAEWRVKARSRHQVKMATKAFAGVDQKAVLRKLPALIKAYLRLGCYIGEGAVIDSQFNTTDVLIVQPVSVINPKYFNHYGAP